MRILVIAEKKKFAQPYVDSLKEHGAEAKYLRVSKIVLVSAKNRMILKSLGKEISEYDAVLIQTRASLAPFIEPLLEELYNRDNYVSAKKGSFFCAENEPYQFVALAAEGVPTPRTLTSGSAKNIEKVSTKISYPLIAKYFVGKKTQQSLVVNNSTELGVFIRSIKQDSDGFMLREFIPADVVSCAVIGKKVLASKRRYNGAVLAGVGQGETYRLNEQEHEAVLGAANAVGLDVARIDIAKGRVVGIEPLINLNEFNSVSSERIEEYVAGFLIEQAEIVKKKRKPRRGIFGIRDTLSKVLRGKVD